MARGGTEQARSTGLPNEGAQYATDDSPIWVAAFALVPALAVVAFDFSLAFDRVPYWCGVSLAEWGGIACATAVFWVAALLAALFANACVARFFRSDASKRCTLIFSSAAGVLLLWVLMIPLAGRSLPPVTLMMALMIVCIAIVFAFLAERRQAPKLSMATALGVALLGTILLMSALGRALMLTEHAAFWTLRVAAIWTGFVLGVACLAFATANARRKPWRRAALVACLALAAPVLVHASPWLLAPAPKPATVRTSLLLITADALRADFCSTYGGDTPTPNLTRLAERGVLFERCYTMAPWTIPSFHSLFASQYPLEWLPHDDIFSFSKRVTTSFFSPEQPTLAERLRDKNYATAMMTSHLSLHYPERFSRGYDLVAQPFMDSAEHRTIFAQVPTFRGVLGRWRPSVARRWPMNCTRRLTAYAKAYLEWHRHRPFFLWVHFMDPHTPYCPPQTARSGEERISFLPVVPTKEPWDPPFLYSEEDAAATPDIIWWNLRQDEAEALYRGEVAYVDSAIGEVLQRLDSLGLTDSTCVVVGADHGEEFGEHGGLVHPHCIHLHDEVMRVPLVIAGADLPPQRVEHPFSTLDLLPTLAGCIGMKQSWYWQGQSAASALRRQEHDSLARPIYGGGNRGDVRARYQMVVRDWDKLIRNLDTGELELYDLASDPGETKNLAEDRPAVAQELDALLDSWESTLPAHDVQPSDVPIDAEADAEFMERLSTMGYVADDPEPEHP